MINKLLNWVLKSSADPNRLALTIKGGIPLVVSVALLFGVQLPQDSLAEAVTSLVAVISSVTTFYGLVRKIYLTIKSVK